MSDQPIVVFTDGAAKGNPGPGGWGVVSVTPNGQVTELGGGEPDTTNNRMELTGAIQGLAHLRSAAGQIAIYTDSTYVIKGIREWIWAWRRRGWKTVEGSDVLNIDLWERLSELVDARGKGAIAWHYVRGHSGICGNERVDEIADGIARGQTIDLYRGSLSSYGRPILDVPGETNVPPRRSTGSAPSKSSGKPYSYLSLVDGTLERHATWAECERRVKGRSGAKFKKAKDATDEKAILKSWGVG